jgi:ADP-ribose pyrophosphatase YjhB (NUDIX family)
VTDLSSRPEISDHPDLQAARRFETPGATGIRQVYFHDPDAPPAAVVVPSVFVVARDERESVLLVRRRDSGLWELPGGRVDVGESAVDAAVRETVEEAGVWVRVVGLVGLFTDPAHVVRAASGEVRQQFVVCFRAVSVGGRPRPDRVETVGAAWWKPAEIVALAVEPAAQRWIGRALSAATEPHLG